MIHHRRSACSPESRDGWRARLRPNLGKGGRWFRGLLGLGFIGAGMGVFDIHVQASYLMVGLGLFGVVEALMGWCPIRASGIKTRF